MTDIEQRAENIGGTAYLLGLGEFTTEDAIGEAVASIQSDAKSLLDTIHSLTEERDRLGQSFVEAHDDLVELEARLSRYEEALRAVAEQAKFDGMGHIAYAALAALDSPEVTE